MGSDYSLGIISEFTASAGQSLTKEEWKKALHDRLDVDIFIMEFGESEVKGKLDPQVFSENIGDFYNVLRKILGADRNGNIDHYEKNYGTEIENYQNWHTVFHLTDETGCKIKIQASFALLFVEGKVMAEEFFSEPLLINWLFRNSTIENKLAGCVISEIVG